MFYPEPVASMKGFLPSALIMLMLSLPTVSRGDMIVRDYASVRHERFYQGSGNDFVGKRYDFSGVGLGSAGHWATLVSDNCFLSANHLHPAVGEKVTFWAANKLTGARFTYAVTGGARIGTSDLWVGWFDTAVDVSIARYPIPLQPFLNRYVGLELYNYGMRHRVGRNVLEVITTYALGESTGLTAGYDYDNNDIPAVDGDETFLRAGDSGAPSFAVFNSRLALVGIHWSVTRNPDSSFDTFVPEYFDEIDKVLKKRGQALRQTR